MFKFSSNSYRYWLYSTGWLSCLTWRCLHVATLSQADRRRSLTKFIIAQFERCIQYFYYFYLLGSVISNQFIKTLYLLQSKLFQSKQQLSGHIPSCAYPESLKRSVLCQHESVIVHDDLREHTTFNTSALQQVFHRGKASKPTKIITANFMMWRRV